MNKLKLAECCKFCVNAEPVFMEWERVVCPHSAMEAARKPHSSYLVCPGFRAADFYERIAKEMTAT